MQSFFLSSVCLFNFMFLFFFSFYIYMKLNRFSYLVIKDMDYFIVQLYSLILFIAYIIFFCCLCIYIICICFLHCLCCAGQKDQPVLHYPMRLPPSWSSYLLIFHTVTTVHPSAVARSCAPSSSMFDDGCLALSLVMAVASGQH